MSEELKTIIEIGITCLLGVLLALILLKLGVI